MKCSVFIAASLDGYIAAEDGSVDWLHTSGNIQAYMSDNPDMGFSDFIASVDCMIMGRKCMEKIASFNLTDEQWPYKGVKVFVLSHTLTAPPTSLIGKVNMISGDIPAILARLSEQGYQHAYIDGGTTITAFLNLQLIDNLVLTQVPVILGKGIPLFGELSNSVKLQQAKATAFANDFVQLHYSVGYD
ncbi:dihydrofolate reductase family protein [Shewanella maritima]|uniref:dihydrofolate reductase family protein n=1 Tax=Shewanella maritima TaxID=2520507 RepID=UPI0037350C2D